MGKALLQSLLQRVEVLAVAEHGLQEPLAGVSSPTLTTLVLLGDEHVDKGKLDLTSCPRLRTLVWVTGYPMQLTIPASLQELCLSGSWVAVNGDVSGLQVFSLLAGRFTDGGAFLERAPQLASISAGANASLSREVEATLTRRGARPLRNTALARNLWPPG
jgi:hypothetical protein